MANRLFWTKALSQEFWAGVVTPLMFSIAGGLIEERMARKGLRIAGLKQLEDEPFLRLLGGQVYLNSMLFGEGFKPAIDMGLSVSRIGHSAGRRFPGGRNAGHHGLVHPSEAE